MHTDASAGKGRALFGRLVGGGRADDPGLGELLRVHRAAYPRPQSKLLRRAYEVAERMHRGQEREDGLPFITHPLAVATILAEFGMDPVALAAALLHDTVEDTPLTLEDVEEQFGGEVTRLVDGLTKLDRIGFESRELAEAETVRKLLVAGGRDLRVLVIKLVDRLHNLRTLGSKSATSQRRIARFTLEVLVPLANRLGIHVVKRELEDIAFATLHPAEHETITRLLDQHAAQRDAWFTEVSELVAVDLQAAKLRADARQRSRHRYSVYEQWLQAGGDLDGVTDAARLLITVSGDASNCYAALGLVHVRWAAVAGRFRDYIALPRFNLYQSLHTTVVGPGGKALEVLIRTQAMHRIAEHGIAAHIRAAGATPRRLGEQARGKQVTRRVAIQRAQRSQWARRAAEPGDAAARVAAEAVTGGEGVPEDRAVRPEQLDWLRRLLQWQHEIADPADFLRGVKTDLEPDDVLVFTPKGEVVALPAGATTIDFAYAVHTEVGDCCIGARVNQRLIPLDYVLTNGDTVEILTGTGGIGPSREWLQLAQTPRARTMIRQGLARHDRQGAAAVAGDGAGRPQGGEIRPRPAPPDKGVVVNGSEDAWVRLARCCTPAPRDHILGIELQGQGGVSVHRVECPNAERLRQARRRLVEVGWAASSTATFAVTIRVESLDRVGLLHDVTGVLADHAVTILSASVATDTDRVATLRFTLELDDISRLRPVLAAIQTVEGVYDAYRLVPLPDDGRSRHPLEEVREQVADPAPAPAAEPGAARPA